MTGTTSPGPTLCLAGAMTWLLVETRDLGSAARFVPQVVIALTLVLLVAEGLRQAAVMVRERRSSIRGEGIELREWRAIAWVAAIVLLITLLGAAAGAAATMLAYLRLQARVSWPSSLLCGAAVALGLELMRRGLGVPLPGFPSIF